MRNNEVKDHMDKAKGQIAELPLCFSNPAQQETGGENVVF